MRLTRFGKPKSHHVFELLPKDDKKPLIERPIRSDHPVPVFGYLLFSLILLELKLL
jgi:hypothetical protein